MKTVYEGINSRKRFLVVNEVVWELPRLASEFLSSLPFFDLPPLPPPPLTLLLLADKRVGGQTSSSRLKEKSTSEAC